MAAFSAQTSFLKITKNIVKTRAVSAITKDGLPPTAKTKQVMKKAIGRALGIDSLAKRKSEEVTITNVDNMLTYSSGIKTFWPKRWTENILGL